MNPDTERPHGIYPIVYAFFDERGELDRVNMRAQIEACIASGAHGIAMLGLITEVSALTPKERKMLVEWVSEDINGRVPLAVTIAGTTAQEEIDLAAHAKSAGADWMVLQPPLGEKPSSKELLKFFDRVMEKVDSTVGIQNVPEILGVGLEADEIVSLRRQHAHFTVMKGEGPVVQVKKYLDLLHGEVAVFNGRGGMELPDNLRAGCAGMIPAPDCADYQVRLYEAETKGNADSANQIYHEILPYVVFAMQQIDFHVVYGKKMFADRIGIIGGERSRIETVKAEPFFEQAMQSWASRFGKYGTRA